MPFAPKHVIAGKYEVLELVAEGGFGTVYRVRHRYFDEVLALKVLKPVPGIEIEHLAHAMIAEAKLLKRLSHPNIVNVRDVEIGADGLPMIAMEFIEGESLRTFRERIEGPLPIEGILAGIVQICEALTFAHSRGVIHRDVKPSNIMIQYPGGGEAPGSMHVKLIDFSIAHVREDATAAPEGSGAPAISFLGTAPYISPEQAERRKGTEVDARSDLYSLALVVYELLAGRLPFDGSEAVMAYQRLFVDPAPPTAFNPAIPEAVSDVIMGALRRNRELRYPTVKRFCDALVAAVEQRHADPLPGPVEPTKLLFHGETVYPNNGDYFLLANQIGLYVIASGFGENAHESAVLAANTVAEVVFQHADARRRGVEGFRGDYLLLGAFEEANRRALAKHPIAGPHASVPPGVAFGLPGRSFVSMTALLDAGDVHFIASVGDTRAYVFADAQLRKITEDQTWEAEVGRRLELDEETLESHPLRRMITMSVGMQGFRVNYYSIPERPGMKILLASNGVYRALPDTEIWEEIAKPFDLPRIAHAILGRAQANETYGNKTVVLIKVVSTERLAWPRRSTL
jgi:serine/threonine protein kinase